MGKWQFRRTVTLALVTLLGFIAPALAAEGGEEEVETRRDLVYAELDGAPLRADLYRPAHNRVLPGVLMVHGGAWMSGSKANVTRHARIVATAGYAVLAINYRLAPTHKFPAQLDDCRAALRYFRSRADEFHVDPDRIAGYGYSAGGHLVALMGTAEETPPADHETARPAISTRLQAVVAGGAPCEFRIFPADNSRLAYWLGGTRGERPEAYKAASPLAFVSRDDPPMFFFHGGKDLLVPKASPLAMTVGLTAVGVKNSLHVIPEAGHLGAFIDEQAPHRAVEFLNEVLRRAPADETDRGQEP